MSGKNYWCEIRNDYCDEHPTDAGDAKAVISIDAWKAGKDQGSVIARVILTNHGDVVVDYVDPVARVDEMAKESIRDAVKQLREIHLEQSEKANAPEKIYILDELVMRMAHYAGEMEAKGKIAPPEWDDLSQAIQFAIKEYYDSPSETNPFHIEDVAEKVFLERFPREAEKNSLHSFYYTFGTWEGFPFQKGWVEVQAQYREQADEIFRSAYPDKNPDTLLCSSVYTEENFKEHLDQLKDHPDWAVCHKVLSANDLAKDVQSAHLSSSNGTLQVMANLTKAWRAIHEAYLGISEINEGSWKQGQEPLAFTGETSPELAASIRDISTVMDKLYNASKVPNYKEAVLLTCSHEHDYGVDLHASVHHSNEEALACVDSVKDDFDYEENKAGEKFDYDIESVVIDVSTLKSAEIEHQRPQRAATLDEQIRQAEGKKTPVIPTQESKTHHER